MRILQSSEAMASIPQASRVAAEPDLGRLEGLERIVKSILQRLQALEEKMGPQGAPPKSFGSAALACESKPIPVPALVFPKIAVDEEALKKGLLDKMWKYLNQGQ